MLKNHLLGGQNFKWYIWISILPSLLMVWQGVQGLRTKRMEQLVTRSSGKRHVGGYSEWAQHRQMCVLCECIPECLLQWRAQ